MRKYGRLIVIAILIIVGVYKIAQKVLGKKHIIEQASTQHYAKPTTQVKNNTLNQSKHYQIPKKVYDVLGFIKKYNKAPNNYVGGREFKNREHKLNSRTSEGKNITYREWDVNPKIQGHNRGRERLITGDDDRAWYTSNHYKTFIEVK